MNVGRWSRIGTLMVFFGLASFASGQTPESLDGLVKSLRQRPGRSGKVANSLLCFDH